MPGWFNRLSNEGVVVPDFTVTKDGVWVTDMASGEIRHTDKNGNTEQGFSGVALPLRIVNDGENGVW